jgi:WD40 repeat protein
MPKAKWKRQITAPEEPVAVAEDEQVSAVAVMSAFEQICVAMPVSGAVIAVRDSQAIRCVASFGDAPAVGSRLQSDSTLVGECIETGAVVLCEDIEEDSRIQLPLTKGSHPRSAVAVPIRVRGSVIGLIEVFSSQLPSISPTTVAALQLVASQLAPIIAFEWGLGGQPLAGEPGLTHPDQGTSPPHAHTENSEGLTEHQAVVGEISPEHATLSAQSIIEQEPSFAMDTGFGISQLVNELKDLSQRQTERDAEGNTFRRRAARIAPASLWLTGAGLLLLFAILFLFMESGRKRVKMSSEPGVPAVSDRAKQEGAGIQVSGARDGEAATTQTPRATNLSRNADVPPLSASSSKSRSNRDPSSVPAVTDATKAIPSNGSTSQPELQAAVPRELKPPNPASDKVIRSRSSSALAPAAPALSAPVLSSEPPVTEIVPATQALASPIWPGNTSPAFVLDRTFKGHSGWVTGVAFSSYGQFASGSWDQSIKFWDVRTGQEMRALQDKVLEIEAVAFSRDGKWLAAENSRDTVTLWDVATGNQIRTLHSDKLVPAVGQSWVYSIAFSPDGRWLASGVDDKTVRIWDTRTGNRARDLTGLRRSIIYVAFSPDGHLIASGKDDKTIAISDVSTGGEVRTLAGHKKPIFAIAFSPNGRWLASASGDKTVKLWDIATGVEIRTLTGHQNAVTSLAFSPDGRWLASGSWDKTVKLWNVATGNELQTLRANVDSIYTVAFDPRGRLLASGSQNGTINIWRLSDTGTGTGLRTSP